MHTVEQVMQVQYKDVQLTKIDNNYWKSIN